MSETQPQDQHVVQESSYDCYDLPDCLWIEILLRLPLVFLFRLRCVSKRWLSLISDPSFASSNISRFHASPSWRLLNQSFFYSLMPNLLVSYEVTMKKMVSKELCLPDFLTSDYVSIVASSNGLLFRLCEYDRNEYYVCNLITKEWFALPQPGIDRNIMLDGFASRLEGGVVTSYKVLRYLYNGEPGENEFVTAEIYSSETGEWSSEFQVNWDRPSYRSTDKAVACNGIVYWLSPGGGGIKAYNLYDGPTDCCNMINLPSDRDLDSVNGGLDHKASMCDLCQGELQYVKISGKRLARTLNVWGMKNCDAGKWCLERSIRVIDMGCDDGLLKKSISGSGYPFACHPFDLDIIYISCDEGAVPYNLRTRRLEKPASHAMLGWSETLLCASCLAYPNSQTRSIVTQSDFSKQIDICCDW